MLAAIEMSLAQRETQFGVLLNSVSVYEYGFAKLSHFLRGPIKRERQMVGFKIRPFFGHVVVYWLDSLLGKELQNGDDMLFLR